MSKETICIELEDGSVKECEKGVSPQELLERGELKGGEEIVAARCNEQISDLSRPIEEDCKLELVSVNTEDGVEILRHSTAHAMAQAVKRLYPGTQITIGPTIEDGFYYDFYTAHSFTPEDLEKIEEEMKRIVEEDLRVERSTLPKEEAANLFVKMGEPFKAEIIRGLDEEEVSLYQQGDFIDLCRGPHVPRTGVLRAFKLMSTSGAYWRGDETRERLQRIYGTAWATPQELKQYLHRIEEAKRRDHRRLGKQLDLFSVHEKIGPGLIIWHPKGAMIRSTIEEIWKREHLRRGYHLIYTPHIARQELWQTSGHLAFYQDYMYAPMEVEGTPYRVKPMNCPFHLHYFQNDVRSYRDLPIRLTELGTVYRYERSGVLHGLLRVRGFTQDDAHIFCRPDQLEDEIRSVLQFMLLFLKRFDFQDFEVFLSTRPEKSVGSAENWQQATDALKNAVESVGLDFTVDPGEGVFYGPKIDVKIKDSLGRSWQCSTVQVDFNLPERFDLKYVQRDGSTTWPIMIHRALMGSMERFFGILIEHYAGAFPVWLAPVQAKVVTITDDQIDYAEKVASQMKEAGIRVETDLRNEKLGFKIREAQLQKIPYMIVIGQKEVASQTVTLRHREGENRPAMRVEEVIDLWKKEIDAEGGDL